MAKINNERLTGFVEYLCIEFVSGKYFKDKKEIKDIKGYIVSEFKNLYKQFPQESHYKYIIEAIKTDPKFDHEGRWHQLQLLDRLDNDDIKYVENELPFDLDDKQLQILNILLFHPEEEYMFITTGVGGSGKSTFLNIVRQIFENDTASATLSDLKNSFIMAEAVKHRLICSDELAKDDLDEGVIKTLISKQPVMSNPKNEKPYVFLPQSALFFCCNKAPRVDLTDSGILRRIVYYERNTKIKNPNPNLKNKVFTEDELYQFVLRAFFMENEDWYSMFEKETNKYLKSNHSITTWLNHIPDKRKFMSMIFTDNEQCYLSYKEWCLRYGFKSCNLSNFEDICLLFFG